MYEHLCSFFVHVAGKAMVWSGLVTVVAGHVHTISLDVQVELDAAAYLCTCVWKC